MNESTLKLPRIDPPHELLRSWQGFMDWVFDHATELMIAAAVGTGIVVVLLGIRMFGCRLLRNDHGVGWRVPFERALARTKFFFMLMVALKVVITPLDMPGFLPRLVNVLFVAATAFQVAIWVRAFVLGYIEKRAGASEGGTLGSAIDLIRVLLSVALFAIAIILVLDNLGVNVTGLIAGLGIGGIAIGFAAQGIFSDLFAALAIIFDKPFRRGDSINVGGNLTGTVEHIGLKTTRIRAVNGEQVVYGNAELLKQRLHNFAVLVSRRVVMQLGVTYQTPIDVLEAIPAELKAIVETPEAASFDRAHMYQFGDSSIDFELVFHVNAPDYATYMQTRHDVMLGIMRRFAALGVEFAYPTTVNFTAAPDGQAIMPYPPVKMVSEADDGTMHAAASSAPQDHAPGDDRRPG